MNSLDVRFYLTANADDLSAGFSDLDNVRRAFSAAKLEGVGSGELHEDPAVNFIGKEYNPRLHEPQPQFYDKELVSGLRMIGSYAGLIAPFITALGVWLQAHNGRKVRLKVGDVEAEARTTEEVERLLLRAQEIKQSTEPAKIVKP